MKAIKSIVVLTIVLLLQSCTDKPKEDKPIVDNSKAISASEIVQGDTINKTDSRGLKQGEWRLTDWSASNGKHKQILIESGNYIDNKKEGAWHYYDSSGKLNRTITFKDDWPIK